MKIINYFRGLDSFSKLVFSLFTSLVFVSIVNMSFKFGLLFSVINGFGVALVFFLSLLLMQVKVFSK